MSSVTAPPMTIAYRCRISAGDHSDSELGGEFWCDLREEACVGVSHAVQVKHGLRIQNQAARDRTDGKPRWRPVAQTPFSRTLHAPVASLAESPDRTGLHARRPHRPAGRCLPPCTFAESSPRQAGLRWTRLVFIQRPIHRVNCARLSPVIFARKRRTIPFWPRLIRRYCWARPALEMTRRLRLFAHWIILIDKLKLVPRYNEE